MVGIKISKGKKSATALTKWYPSIILMVIISIFSSVQGSTINALGLGKESYHINGHFVFFVLLCFSYYKATKNIFKSVLLTFMFGIIDEFHQTFTPFRSSSYFDILVDSTGGFISGIILWKLQQILPKKLVNWLNK